MSWITLEEAAARLGVGPDELLEDALVSGRAWRVDPRGFPPAPGRVIVRVCAVPGRAFVSVADGNFPPLHASHVWDADLEPWAAWWAAEQMRDSSLLRERAALAAASGRALDQMAASFAVRRLPGEADSLLRARLLEVRPRLTSIMRPLARTTRPP